MLANLTVVLWTMMLQAETSWDLRSMWNSMSGIARGVVIILFGFRCGRSA